MRTADCPMVRNGCNGGRGPDRVSAAWTRTAVTDRSAAMAEYWPTVEAALMRLRDYVVPER